ncbi:mitotic spindle checkpoint protein [Sporothrix brasiliensis 5110]|uniref:Mitotic spindle checkpoint protein n=1 Tax=Sporothrix brasiliensis 5110 TaxID=1398154 RepID=A0A0C2FCI8_9PEZI|nr:mitotic spindle checkpoint protein [Sporothrix brasiliensis 5110]KIH88833.1 mitotic spindle checkpoint protein [Sporothrix brasiliensis 5110]
MSSLSLDEAARLYSTLHHFFEVAVHAILYYRRLYPERAFASATAFDVPVHQSRHPAVCAWVRAAVEHVMIQIAGGETDENSLPADNVNAVAVVVHAPYKTTAGSAQAHSLPPGAVLERWVFDVRHLPRGWPGGAEVLRRTQKDTDKRGRQDEERDRERRGRRRRRISPDKADTDGTEEGLGVENGGRYNYYDEEEELANAESEAELDESGSASEGAGDEDETADVPQAGSADAMNWKDLNDQLRGVLQRLAQAGQQLGSLPNGCTFTMAIELGDGDRAEQYSKTRDVDANWVPEVGSHRRKFGGGSTSGVGASTTSIRSIDSTPLFLECWVEESAVKQAAAEGAPRAKLAATARSAGDLQPPPPAASTSTATSNGSFSFDKIMAPHSSINGEGTPQTNKGKTVSFS